MTQDAVVKRIAGPDTAEAAVLRAGACGGSCASCAGCAQNHVATVLMRNTVGAQCGEHVHIQKRGVRTVLPYLAPVLGFLLGYLLTALLRCEERLSIVLSFAGLLLGLAATYLIRKRVIAYEIVSIEKNLK